MTDGNSASSRPNVSLTLNNRGAKKLTFFACCAFTGSFVTLSIIACRLTSTKRSKVYKKSAPRMFYSESATIKFHLNSRRSPRYNFKREEPNVFIGEPFAAKRAVEFLHAVVLFLYTYNNTVVHLITDTSAPVSTKKRRCEI